jgi:hypothetical protein
MKRQKLSGIVDGGRVASEVIGQFLEVYIPLRIGTNQPGNLAFSKHTIQIPRFSSSKAPSVGRYIYLPTLYLHKSPPRWYIYHLGGLYLYALETKNRSSQD